MTPAVPIRLGDKIKLLRNQFKYSQHRMVEEIKERLGHLPKYANYSQPAYQRLESNGVKRPDPQLLNALADIFDTSVAYLISSSDSKSIDHLPPNVQDFLADPNNANLIRDAYQRLSKERLRLRLEKLSGK